MATGQFRTCYSEDSASVLYMRDTCSTNGVTVASKQCVFIAKPAQKIVKNTQYSFLETKLTPSTCWNNQQNLQKGISLKQQHRQKQEILICDELETSNYLHIIRIAVW